LCSFGRKFRRKRVVKFLRKIKEALLWILDFRNLKILKKGGACINNCKFAKDGSIPVTFFTG